MVRLVPVLVLSTALAGAACGDLLGIRSQTGPSLAIDGLTGSWASVASATSLPNTCTDFKWTISDVSSSSASGTFTATCGIVAVAGTAGATTGSGSTINWTVDATGTTSSGIECPIALSGTAVLETAQIRITYSGTTCAGPVTGTEILRRS
jgi:hypothetical protein